MKTVFISIFIVQTIIIICIWRKGEKKLLNMANTISPIIQQISEKLGDYENIQISSKSAKGGQLIYKRESVNSCISGIGNVYYIRYYEWGYKNGKGWNKPTHDEPLGCYSCIPEKNVVIPYEDKKLQNATLGIKFYR